jgi:VWFA-related protein
LLLTDQGVEVEPPSTDGNELGKYVEQIGVRLRAITQTAGAWGDVERLQTSVQVMMSIAQNEAQTPGRKLLIWTSPGWPMLEGVMLQGSSKEQQGTFNEIVQLSTKLREARIFVYSVSSLQNPGLGSTLYEDFLKGVKTPESANAPNLALKVLAVQSGGRALSPFGDLADEINSCIQDAGAFYTLSFDPPRTNHANEYHELHVKIDKPGLTARTNTGYYDQP